MATINRPRTILSLTILVAVVAALCLLFPAALAFVELAAREIRYLWWLVLLVVLGLWMIFGISRKPK